jgi:hypothetical protein
LGRSATAENKNVKNFLSPHYVKRCKEAWRGVDQPPHLGPKLKKEYSFIFTTSVTSWPVLG